MRFHVAVRLDPSRGNAGGSAASSKPSFAAVGLGEGGEEAIRLEGELKDAQDETDALYAAIFRVFEDAVLHNVRSLWLYLPPTFRSLDLGFGGDVGVLEPLGENEDVPDSADRRTRVFALAGAFQEVAVTFLGSEAECLARDLLDRE